MEKDREEMKELDKQIAAAAAELEAEMRRNVEVVQKIGKDHVLGTYSAFLEARFQNLKLQMKNLKAKRKYEHYVAIEVGSCRQTYTREYTTSGRLARSTRFTWSWR